MSAFLSVQVPAGLTLLPGGTRNRFLPHQPLPDVALSSTAEADLLCLLSYAGVRYAAANSPAAWLGMLIFNAARSVVMEGRHDAVTFDWDHTFCNYQVFEDVPQLLRVHRLRRPPVASATPMAALEVTRPFMVELALGMMVGFALRQGLTRFSQWRAYAPRVGVASLTWPDRIARLAAHYVPILSLMEGLVPGDPDTYDRFTSPAVRSVLHLHHFLGYCEELFARFRSGEDLKPMQGQELVAYAVDRKAHCRKPLGTWTARNWPISKLLHVDDSTVIVRDLTRQAALAGCTDARFLHAPHPHSNIFRNVRDWHKVSLRAFWRARPQAVHSVTATLVRQEWARSNIPSLLKVLGVSLDDHSWPKAGLPEGTVMMLHETPTTLGEFWEYYVAPTNRARALIRNVSRDSRGLSQLRRRFRHTRAA
jgi:hypothetical protein